VLTLALALFPLSTPSARATHTTPRLVEFATWVDALHRQYPSPDRFLIEWARGRLGTPYVLDCQGEGHPPDADPLFTPDRVDCTVFILQAAASRVASTADGLVRGMLAANYRRWRTNGTVDFRDRLHFSEDRLVSSPLFEDITSRVLDADTLVRERVTLNRRPDRSLVMPIGWSREMDVVYRPSSALQVGELNRLPPVCGVLFIKRSNLKFGPLVGHEGLVLHGRILIHASSKQRRVVMEPFVRYARDRDGVVFFRFLPIEPPYHRGSVRSLESRPEPERR